MRISIYCLLRASTSASMQTFSSSFMDVVMQMSTVFFQVSDRYQCKLYSRNSPSESLEHNMFPDEPKT